MADQIVGGLLVVSGVVTAIVTWLESRSEKERTR